MASGESRCESWCANPRPPRPIAAIIAAVTRRSAARSASSISWVIPGWPRRYPSSDAARRALRTKCEPGAMASDQALHTRSSTAQANRVTSPKASSRRARSESSDEPGRAPSRVRTDSSPRETSSVAGPPPFRRSASDESSIARASRSALSTIHLPAARSIPEPVRFSGPPNQPRPCTRTPRIDQRSRKSPARGLAIRSS
mgnify:CR=1 FL=1